LIYVLSTLTKNGSRISAGHPFSHGYSKYSL
jgi:hypothetical protein